VFEAVYEGARRQQAIKIISRQAIENKKMLAATSRFGLQESRDDDC